MRKYITKFFIILGYFSLSTFWTVIGFLINPILGWIALIYNLIAFPCAVSLKFDKMKFWERVERGDFNLPLPALIPAGDPRVPQSPRE